MDKGNCTGLHPHGPCAPGEGCNREQCGVFEIGGPCGDERAPGWDMCRYHLRQHVTDLRARVAELEAHILDIDARERRGGA